MFRTIHITLFLGALSAVGIHCHHAVFAQQEAPSAASAQQPSPSAPSSPSAVPVAPSASVSPPPAAAHADNDIYEVDENRQISIPFKKVIRLSRSAPLGEASAQTTGADGVLEKTYRVTYKGDHPIKFAFASEKVLKKPVDMVVLAGYTDREARALPSRSGYYTRTNEFDMIATGYSPHEGSGRGRCANGMAAGFGVVAVDPRIIPLGSKLYIDGYGYAVAGDTGGAIRGDRIDLGQNTFRAACLVGRRHVHVYVLSEGR